MRHDNTLAHPYVGWEKKDRPAPLHVDAVGQVRAGHAERMRSLVGAVPLRDTG